MKKKSTVDKGVASDDGLGAVRYVSLGLQKHVGVVIMGTEVEIPLTFGEGMIGALPVFDTEEAAKKFAGGKYKTCRIEMEKP